MRARSLDRTPVRSIAVARRAGVVALAAALVVVPLVGAVPAHAGAPFYLDSVTIPDTELAYGEQTQAYLKGDPNLTQIDDLHSCTFEYKNGVPLQANVEALWTAYAPALNWDVLAADGFASGDVYTVAYTPPVGNSDQTAYTCAAPALDTPGLVQASLTLTTPPAETPPAETPPVDTTPPVETTPPLGETGPSTPLVQRTASAAPLSLKQGVAFDQIVAITLGEGFDFTAGGYVVAGPQSSAGLDNGEINPLEGIVFEYSETETGQPQLRVHGTPKYSGPLVTGFEIGDGASYGGGQLALNVADKNGLVAQISIAASVGQPVAGSTATIIVEGLQIGAAWSATVRSTPIVVGTGVVNAAGRIAATVTIPAGLEAGNHSITVLSTTASGAAFSTVLYFRLSATGALLAISTTPAVLAATGQDFAPSLFIAGGLLLAGGAFAGITVVRRRRTA